jgi:hypothetical protein
MELSSCRAFIRLTRITDSRAISDQVSDNHHRQRWTPADTHGQSVPGHACCGAGSPRLYLASGRRGRGPGVITHPLLSEVHAGRCYPYQDQGFKLLTVR